VQLEGDRLRVADQGLGISEADMPHIFDRFYRGDSARQTSGTGLGLRSSPKTVTQHGGWVTGRSFSAGWRRIHDPAAGRDQPRGAHRDNSFRTLDRLRPPMPLRAPSRAAKAHRPHRWRKPVANNGAKWHSDKLFADPTPSSLADAADSSSHVCIPIAEPQG
jgi:hypothetical protein